MNDVLFLYLFTRLDNAIQLLVGVLALCIVLAFSIGLLHIEANEEEVKRLQKKLAIVFGVAATAAVLLVAIPSERDMAIIVGGKYALEAARSPEAAEIGGLVMDAVRATLKKAAD